MFLVSYWKWCYNLKKNSTRCLWCIWNAICNSGKVIGSSRFCFPLYKASLGFKLCRSPCLERKVGIGRYSRSWSGNSNSEVPLGILMKNQLNGWQLTKQIDMIIRLSKQEKNDPVLDSNKNHCWNPQFKKSFDNLEKDLRRGIETT